MRPRAHLKKTIIILFLVSIYFVGFGQEKKDSLNTKKESKWSFGVSGGANYTTKTKPYDDENLNIADAKIKYKSKFNIGGLINCNLIHWFSFSFGCNFTNLEYQITGWDDHIGHRVDYLKIYQYQFVNANFMFKGAWSFKRFNFNVGLGPQFGVLINDNQ